MNYSVILAGVVTAFLGLVGAVMRPLAESARQSSVVTMARTGLPDTGQGSSFAVLGGLRTIVADLTWLRAYVSWESHDAPSTETLLKLTTTIDPAPLYFWLNGARMIAYDFPAWLAGDHDSDTEREVLVCQQAHRAIAYLNRALDRHPGRAALWIERANIELHRLHDLPAAAESYREAAEAQDAPYFAARIHAELLRRTGRKAEALARLTRLYPTLPRNDEAAGAALVLARIRTLEAELLIPPTECFAENSNSSAQSVVPLTCDAAHP